MIEKKTAISAPEFGVKLPREKGAKWQGDEGIRGEDCPGCAFRAQCITHSLGCTVSRWEYEEILEDMRQRVESNRTKVKMRQ
jgi:hypothetical protein